METITSNDMKINEFANLLEVQQIQGLHKSGLAFEANIHNSKTSVKKGKKFTRVDVGSSGKYMVDNETGQIFGIKAYGVVHRGHQFGTLDTINEWNWSGYRATKIT